MGYVVHHVFENLRPIGALDQRAEHGANFALTGSRHFVVMHFNRNANGFQGEHHGRADIVQAIDWRNREITAFYRRTVTRTAATFNLLARTPCGFLGMDLEVAAGHIDAPLNGVENEEFRLRPEIGGITDTGGFQIGFGTLGNRAWIAVVTTAISRIYHVASNYNGGFIEEWIDVGRRGIRHE